MKSKTIFSSQVFCKLTELNERLVCGCGGWSALQPLDAFSLPTRCPACPDGGHRCGAAQDEAVAVYELLQGCSGEEVSDPVPHPTLRTEGCFTAPAEDLGLLLTATSLDVCVGRCADPNATHHAVQYFQQQQMRCFCGWVMILSQTILGYGINEQL